MLLFIPVIIFVHKQFGVGGGGIGCEGLQMHKNK